MNKKKAVKNMENILKGLNIYIIGVPEKEK